MGVTSQGFTRAAVVPRLTGVFPGAWVLGLSEGGVNRFSVLKGHLTPKPTSGILLAFTGGLLT